MKQRYKVDLPKHLSGCEANYWRLRRLLPQLMQADVDQQWCFIMGNNPSNESTISLKVIEQTKYTSVVHIVQYTSLQKVPACVKYTINKTIKSKLFDLSRLRMQKNNQNIDLAESQTSALNEVKLKNHFSADVRLYHDADVAEVVKCQHHRQFNSRYEYPNKNMHQVDEKARINQFLGELIAHCLLHARVSDSVVNEKYANKAL